MRVGFVVEQLLAPVPGGTGRYSAELAAALARTAQPPDVVAGWCAAHRGFDAAALPGVLGPMRLPLPRRALAATWSRGVGPAPRGVDVLHAPTLLLPPAGGTSGQAVRLAAERMRGGPAGGGSGAEPSAAARRIRRSLLGTLADSLERARPRPRLVVTIHDAVPWTHPETLTAHGARWHRQMGERAARLADAVVVPTLAVAAEISRHLPLDPQRLHVIGEGVTEAVVRVPADAEARAMRLGLPPAGGYLLTLATCEPRKGLDTALAALCHPDDPGLPLVHVGAPGWGGLDVRSEAARLGLGGDRVRTLGRISDEDLAVVLSRAGALLAPSRSEGFGLPVVEAMAHGVPVIVSTTPALVEVAGPAALVTGIGDVAALAAAVRRLVGDPALRARLSSTGQARAQMFTWNAAARETWALYRRVCGSPAVSVADDGPA
ncbi:glycosyltransferase family 4 protein [Frankia sp. AgPm24]|uniref:glycosyltransferase family 4 protein n=1 Tax=Frankia sp. AgPm24 TaxID=631128 RepID=UPI00200D7E45|nr:glycosyltransferase family 1 protein [Frankia sp. AgPm24]MCK9922198.1 glycosyltransferase family 4 protein [Frankia sp. AgPm24]